MWGGLMPTLCLNGCFLIFFLVIQAQARIVFFLKVSFLNSIVRETEMACLFKYSKQFIRRHNLTMLFVDNPTNTRVVLIRVYMVLNDLLL